MEKPNFEEQPKETESVGKKILAGVVVAGVALGASERVVATEDTVSDLLQNEKSIEQEVQTDYAQEYTEKLEEQFGGKIVIPEPSIITQGEKEKLRGSETIPETSDLKEETEENQEKEKPKREYKEDFSLGLESVQEGEIDADTLKQIRILSGDTIYGDSLGDRYKEDAFTQMYTKYGKERFEEVIRILHDMYPKNGKEMSVHDTLKVYGITLPKLEAGDQKEKLNTNLYNVVDLMEEGGIEKVQELFTLLREEGYTKMPGFSWNMEKIHELVNDPEERKGLLYMTNEVGGLQISTILEESGISRDEFWKLSYKEQMKIAEPLVQSGKIIKKQ